MQIQPPDDAHLNLGDMMKVEPPDQAMATPSRSLPRSASALPDPPSPFSSNPAHQPVTAPPTPAASASARADPPPPSPFSSNHQPVTTPLASASARAASSVGGSGTTATPTGTPPGTPAKDVVKTTKAAPSIMSFAAFWNPRRLMQRAARAFRITSRSRRRIKFDEPAAVALATKRVSDAASAGSPDVEHGSNDGNNDNNGGAAADDDKMLQLQQQQQREEEEPHGNNDGDSNGAAADDKVHQRQQEEEHQPIEVVPEEKIIHVANHEPVVKEADAAACETDKTADEKETSVAADEEEPIKKGAVIAVLPDDAVADNNANDDMLADKFCMVVKEAMMKKLEEQREDKEEAADDTKNEAMRRFQGRRRVKTAMEARAESEQPQRRDAARRSNDVIEEACAKLLATRQGSRVKALVGAFETVMDVKTTAAVKTPRHYHKIV